MVYHESPQVDPARQAMVMILVWLWGIRLTANWATHWTGTRRLALCTHS
ncbi:MAG: DUF1295 domain-containing protein [Gammaproteobacteria bacterium]